jgi:hypothetical protein
MVVVLLVAGGVVVAERTASNNHQGGAAVAAGTGAAPSWVAQLAKQRAEENGDPHPSSAQVVMTTRRPAHQMIAHAWGGSDQPTYLVVLQGHFADTHARTPDGRTVYGTVLMLNIDAATQDILDFGLGYRVPPIAQLGSVRDITGILAVAQTD